MLCRTQRAVTYPGKTVQLSGTMQVAGSPSLPHYHSYYQFQPSGTFVLALAINSFGFNPHLKVPMIMSSSGSILLFCLQIKSSKFV
jgi:hypothetical protein